jgi:hypothetical protein
MLILPVDVIEPESPRKFSFVNVSDENDDDVNLEKLQYGKGFHIICSVYMSYVKHINLANKA